MRLRGFAFPALVLTHSIIVEAVPFRKRISWTNGLLQVANYIAFKAQPES
jgi:hypothetical protein